MNQDRVRDLNRTPASPGPASERTPHGYYVAVLETEKATFGLALSDPHGV